MDGYKLRDSEYPKWFAIAGDKSWAMWDEKTPKSCEELRIFPNKRSIIKRLKKCKNWGGKGRLAIQVICPDGTLVLAQDFLDA